MVVSALRVTPERVPPTGTKRLPDVAVMVPPVMVPPSRHGPVVSSRARVVPVLLRVPVRLTVPPERLKVPRPARVKEPPRFTVEFVVLMVPSLSQEPLRARVPPLLMDTVWPRAFWRALRLKLPPFKPSIVPWFVVVPVLIVMVLPEVSDLIVPWLRRISVP